MTARRIERFLIAIMFALFAAGITMIVANAQNVEAQPAAQFTSNCTSCHTEYQMTWESGAHGQAGNDPVFLTEWENQGKPGACLVCHTTGYDPETATYAASGVTCEACHGPANPEHPNEPMPVDRSPDLCGRCHSDTRFGWQDWTVSTHYQRGMDCATCHDPHSASLKTVDVPFGTERPADEVSQLCINCHQEYSMEFSYTSHHQQGISCVDCHVKHLENDERAAHTVPDHSFNASLQSCNTCHAQQMHSPTDAINNNVNGTSSPASAQADIQLASVTPVPDPVSPIGFSLMAGLIGLAMGMVLAPWLERWYHRTVKEEVEEDDEQQ